jgi:hypothetical protein
MSQGGSMRRFDAILSSDLTWARIRDILQGEVMDTAPHIAIVDVSTGTLAV